MSVIPILSLKYFIEAAQGTLSGTVRGLGLQGEAAKYILPAYYLIGFPLGLFFAFGLGLEVRGLWLAATISVSIQCCVFLRVIMRANWQEIANRSCEVIQEFKATHKQASN